MSDALVDRLRADYHAVARCEKDNHYSPLLLEAADRLEQLERELAEARQKVDLWKRRYASKNSVLRETNDE